MQLLGGQAPPRKYDYLTVYDPQENVFTCRLFTPKKMYLLVGLLIFLSSCRLLHVHVFLGRLAVKKTLLEGQPPRKLYFPCNPNLAVHAWRCTAKKYFLGGFPIFLSGFWPPRKFRSVVVRVGPEGRTQYIISHHCETLGYIAFQIIQNSVRGIFPLSF